MQSFLTEIKNLNKEAEKYNNPTDFAKYAKIQRKVTQLEMKLSELKGEEGEEVSFGIISSLFNGRLIQISYFKIFASLLLIVSKIILLYFISDKSLYFRDYDFKIFNKNNIIFQHFRNEDNFIIIPIKYIIIVFWSVLF